MTRLILSCGLLIAACGSAQAYDARLADKLFEEFCLSHKSAAASDRAIAESKRFGPRQVRKIGSATYVSYKIPDVRGVISVTYNAAGRIQCAVGIENRGPVLYENGRIDND